MNKSTIFLAFLTCFTGLIAMEEHSESGSIQNPILGISQDAIYQEIKKAYRELALQNYVENSETTGFVATTEDGKKYHFNQHMIALCKTLSTLLEDTPDEPTNDPIPLPHTISSAHFDYVYKWLLILAIDNSEHLEALIKVIEEDTFDNNLKASQIQSLIHIVAYLDIQMPGLVEMLEERKHCTKVILADGHIWASEELLSNCSVLENMQDFDNNDDEDIELSDITSDIFRAIVGPHYTRSFIELEKPDQKKFKIPTQLIQEIISTDRLGNEIALEQTIKQLLHFIKANLNPESFNAVIDALHTVLTSVPETIQYRIYGLLLHEYYAVEQYFGDRGPLLAKTDELTLQQKIDYLLFYSMIVAPLPEDNKLALKELASLKKLVVSSPTFFEFGKIWQGRLMKSMYPRTAKSVAYEFKARKNAVNHKRGLVKLAAKKIVDDYFNNISKEQLLENIDAHAADFNKKILNIPDELKIDIAYALFEKTMKRILISKQMPYGKKRGFLRKRESIPQPEYSCAQELLNFAFMHHCLSHSKEGRKSELIKFIDSKLYKELFESQQEYLDTLVEEGYAHNIIARIADNKRVIETAFRNGCLDFGIGYASSIGFQAFEQAILNSCYSDNSSWIKKCTLGLTSLGLKAAYYYGLTKMPRLSQDPYTRILGSALGSYTTSDCYCNPLWNCFEIIKVLYTNAYTHGAVEFGPQAVKDFFRKQ